MVDKAEVLAIIPARGGSKGIPRKNIKLFSGYPLIAWSIAAAKQSESVTRVIVSTDDEEIAAVAREWGAETPFLRPSEFAADNSLDLPVFRHAVQWLADNENYHPDIVIQLRPTSPVRPLGLIDEAVNLLLAHPEADSVRGVVPSGENPYKMWRIDNESGYMHGLLELDGVAEPYNSPRQKLPPTWWQTGHIDAIRPERTFMTSDSMSGKNILSVLVDPDFTVDIDTPFDWIRYEWLVANAGLNMVTPAPAKRPLPEKPALLVLDFDGVLTDDRVYVHEDGTESVCANRSDGMGIRKLVEKGCCVVVISTETNSVVRARCTKLGIEAIQGVMKKGEILQQYLSDNNINAADTVYCGNDINDLPCFPIVGCAVAPCDAQPEALEKADLVLTRKGGYGAVRELCDLLRARL